jgi:hypothetical protein
LALQRVQGRQEFLSTEATTEALASYTGELDKVSKLTGIQRQELDKAVRAQQADAVLQSYLAGLAPERETQKYKRSLLDYNIVSCTRQSSQ